MIHKKLRAGVGALAAGLVLAGCATTPESRVEKNAAVVATWPAEIQAQVKEGKVAVGFSAEQVRVALGEPDRITTLTDAKGQREVWIYSDRGPKFSFGIGVGGGSGYGGVSVGSGGRRGRAENRVTLENGRVSELELMRPR